MRVALVSPYSWTYPGGVTRHIEALARVAKGRTVLSITHNPSFAARADLIVFLEAGRAVECGTPAELLRPYVVGA